VNTGKVRWIFHTIPRPGEFGFDTWPKDAYKISGGANAWAGVTVDTANAIVFAATGSASFDFYGVTRKGDNLFADCVLALDARTGKRVWHFQGIKHDVWDYDFPAAPNLVNRAGRACGSRANPRKSSAVQTIPASVKRAVSKCAASKAGATSVRTDSPDRTMIQPSAPCSPPSANKATNRQKYPLGICRRTANQISGSANAIPITRPSRRWIYSQKKMLLKPASVIPACTVCAWGIFR